MKRVILGSMDYDNIEVAESFYSRLKGLLGREKLNDDEGLIITKCNSIHTFFMSFNIDVLFLDEHDTIIKIIRNMKPWRMSWIYFGAVKVLELKAGAIPYSITEGQKVQVVSNV